MANLRVLLEGKELYNIPLAKGREYIIGRSESSDIVLKKSSISREHMKIFFDGQTWHIELISKISKFAPFGDEITNLLLTDGMIFTLEGYEFRYAEDAEVKVEASKPGNTIQNTQMPPSGSQAGDFLPQEGGNLAPDNTSTNMQKLSESSDNTALATRIAASCLHATNEETGEEVLFTLEGNHWIAGRSSSCQIKLSETKSSRQHFELCRTSSGFEIIDLGSSNGTQLNGKKLAPQQRTPVVLGDEIRVGKTTLVFEMRNPKFEDQLAQVASNLFDDDSPMENEGPPNLPATIEGNHSPQNDPYNPPAVIKYEAIPWQGGAGPAQPPVDAKKKKIRMIAGGIIALVVVFAFMGNDDKEGDIESASKGVLDPTKPTTLAKMSPEQKKLAEQTYQLAKKFYIQQKYQLAKIEVDKLHNIVPFYLDSRDMEKYINEAILIESDRVSIELKIQKQKETAETVKQIVRECSTKAVPKTTIAEIQACLQPAVEIDPENKEAQALVDKVTAFEDQKNQTKLAKETRDSQVRKGLGIYSEAQRAEAKSDYLLAMDLYNKFANSGLPDPAGNKVKAREASSNLAQKIKNDITKNLAAADKFKSQEKYKEAWALLRQAMKWDPTDSRILQAMTAIESELKKKMKTLYNDGVLEENIGNLESAKQKWRTICEQDLNDGEYNRKAKSKLKRYGE